MRKKIKLIFGFLFVEFAYAADLKVKIDNIMQTKAPIICALFVDKSEGISMKRQLTAQIPTTLAFN